MIDVGGAWLPALDGDPRALAIFRRHYSRYEYKDGRRPRLFVGPGGKMVLLTVECDALFVWRRFRSDDGQEGVNCAVFRNEGKRLSSDLIREADALAWARWPGERHYTYVDPSARPVEQSGVLFPTGRLAAVRRDEGASPDHSGAGGR